MVHRPQPDSQQLQYSIALDLSNTPDGCVAPAISGLANRRFRGREIALRFGRLNPADLDQRVPALVAEAIDAGVRILIEAEPDVVGSWWRAIQEALAPVPPDPVQRCHLELVKL